MSGNEQQKVRDNIEHLIRVVNSKSIIEDYKRTGDIDLLEYIKSNSESLLKSSRLLSTMSLTIESQQGLIASMLYKVNKQEKQLKLLKTSVIGLSVAVCALTGFVLFVN